MSFLIVAIVCTSMMIPGLISYGILSVRERKTEYRAVILLSVVGILTALTRSVTVGIAMLKPDLQAAVIWNCAFETSLLLFLPAIPFFLTHTVQKPAPQIIKLNRWASYLGILLVLSFGYFIWFRPELYMMPYSPDQLPHPAWLGRGPTGPVNHIATGLLFLSIIYGLIYSVVARVRTRGQKHLTTLNIGFALSVLIILLEFYELIAGRFPGPIPQYAFSRLLVGLTILSLTTVIAMTQKAAIEARMVIEDRMIIKKNRDELALVAYVHPMTGLPNRQALFRDLSTLYGDSGVLILFDIDNLTFVNSFHGYSTGDELIRTMADICRLAVPTKGKLYRVYADIFAVVLDGTVPEAEELAGEILVKVRQIKIRQVGETHYSASAGIAHTKYCRNWEEWIEKANTALVTAKVIRDRYVVFDPSLHENEKRRHSIITGLRKSLDKNGFALLYQPIVTRDGKPIGAEALVRWEHPDLGPISPEEFIPIAESAGLVSRITEFVIRRTLDEFRLFESFQEKLRINVNLSGRDLMDSRLGERVDRIISDYSVEESMLGFEVTETELLGDWEQTRINLQVLKDRGHAISLDDFGTGYSSLSYLSFLPLDKLKVDRSFIADILEDKRKAVLLDTVIDLGQNLDIDLIIEGVETQSQLDYLVDRNCSQFQGYFFSEPLTMQDFRKKFTNTA